MLNVHKGNAKLSVQQVMEIRRLRGEGWTQPALARAFKISVNQIAKICNGTAWANVTMGTEVLTDGEAEVRQLTMPQISDEEIAASQARLAAMLKAQENLEESQIPIQYRRPENYEETIKKLVKEAEERRATSGPPPEPVAVRHVVKETAAVNNAAQLLETLKDETQDQNSNPAPHQEPS